MRKDSSAANTAFRSKVNLYVRRAFKSGFVQSDSIGIFGVSGGVLLQHFGVDRSTKSPSPEIKDISSPLTIICGISYYTPER